jgi:lipopolysaccharide biosynthesis glycosyltransferase
LIPDYSSSEICLYTDADVIFREDIGNLFRECDVKERSMGLVQAGICKSQPERERQLLNQSKKQDGDPYYFSGLALINNKEYKKQETIDKALTLCRNNSNNLVFHDQTVWNCVLKEVSVIHHRWCHDVYPSNSVKKECRDGIIHFVGSPKPWDLLGEFYHPCRKIWYEAACLAGLAMPKTRRYFQIKSWKRALRIKNQYKVWTD